MVPLVPPRKHWLWIAVGFILVIVINLALLSFGLLIPFIATLISVAIVSRVAYKRWSLRGFFAYGFWIVGLEFVFFGVLLLLGAGLIAAVSAAANMAASAMFTSADFFVLGILFLALGIVLWIIGNYVAD